EREQSARRDTGEELPDRQPGDFARQGGTGAAAAQDHLRPRGEGADDRGPDPEEEIRGQVLRRLGNPQGLEARRGEGQNAGERDGYRSVAAKDVGPGQLEPDFRDLGQRLPEFHDRSSSAWARSKASHFTPQSITWLSGRSRGENDPLPLTRFLVPTLCV